MKQIKSYPEGIKPSVVVLREDLERWRDVIRAAQLPQGELRSIADSISAYLGEGGSGGPC